MLLKKIFGISILVLFTNCKSDFHLIEVNQKVTENILKIKANDTVFLDPKINCIKETNLYYKVSKELKPNKKIVYFYRIDKTATCYRIIMIKKNDSILKYYKVINFTDW